MKKIYLLLYTILLLTFTVNLKAQSLSCAERLANAQALYDEGKIHEVEDELRINSSCFNSQLESSLTREEQAQAYRLYVLTFLQMDEPDRADNMMRQLLAVNPEYVINEAVDPIEFINLYNTWRTRPIVKIGLKGGAKYTFFSNKTRINTFDESRVNHLTLAPQFGLTLEFDLSKYFVETNYEKDKFLVDVDFFYSIMKLTDTYEENQVFVEGNQQETIYSYGNINMRAMALYPILNRPSFQLFAALGGQVDMKIKYTGQVDAGLRSGPEGNFTEDLPVDIGDQYKTFSFSAVGGSSVRVKVGSPWLILDLRYNYYFTDPLITDNRYNLGNKQIEFASYVRNEGLLSYVSANLGVSVPIFKHVKLVQDYDE